METINTTTLAEAMKTSKLNEVQKTWVAAQFEALNGFLTKIGYGSNYDVVAARAVFSKIDTAYARVFGPEETSLIELSFDEMAEDWGATVREARVRLMELVRNRYRGSY